MPVLRNGDRLTRAEFERRYSAMAGVNKAELIEGVVYMPSPVRYRGHGKEHAYLITWLGYYSSKTPGVPDFGDNATVRLDEDNEPQPDVLMLLPPAAGGTARIDDDGYIAGGPELACEIAYSSVNIDLHHKLNAYRRNGVKEYLVWRTEDAVIDWFLLQDGLYAPQPGDVGVLKSTMFPGLWLDAPAMLRGDLPAVFAAVDRGVATPEHEAFVERLRG